MKVNIDDIPDDVPMTITRQPIPDKYFSIIHCDKCDKFLAKLFNASQGCIIEENFYNLCEECFNKIR